MSTVNVHACGIWPETLSNSLTVNVHVHGSVAESPSKSATVKVLEDACRWQCPDHAGVGFLNHKVLNSRWEYHLCTCCAQAIVHDVAKSRVDRDCRSDGLYASQNGGCDDVVRVRRH